VLVVVALVPGVPVSVVDVVDVVTVLDGFVAATVAVDVRVLGRLVLAVFCRCGHLTPPLQNALRCAAGREGKGAAMRVQTGQESTPLRAHHAGRYAPSL
jgi:hypothetical protein